MSVLIGDAAFRWTESGQDYLHQLAANLAPVAPNFVQPIAAFESADLTAIRRIAIGNGVHELRATIRFDRNPDQLNELLAAGRRGVPLTYFPSLANPSESYPCKLIEASEVTPDQEMSWDARYQVDIRLRRIDGGSFLGVDAGSLFYYTAGNPLSGLTFTRSGSVGYYTDELGVIQNAAADIVRTTWINGTPHLLVESSAENLAYHTQDIDFVGANQWSRLGLSGVTADATEAPDGTSTADKLVEDSSLANDHRINASFGLGESDDEVVTVSVYAKADQREEIQIEVTGRDGANRNVWFDLDAGTVGTASGATGRIVALANGWYRCTCVATVGSGGIGAGVRIYMGSGSETRSYNGNGSWGLFLWQVDIYLDRAEGSIVPATTARVTRPDETFYATFDHAPQAMTVYMKFVEAGSIDEHNSRLLHIGDGTSGGPLLEVFNNSGGYRFYHLSDIGEDEAGSGFTAPTVGQTVEFLGSIAADGTLTAAQSIDGGAIETATGPITKALASSWAGTRLYLGSRGSTNRCPGLQVETVKVIAGVRDMTAMRAA
ncbi:MAG: hypothetical protein AAF389_14895 [Gemmatimonadota bacterium]